MAATLSHTARGCKDVSRDMRCAYGGAGADAGAHIRKHAAVDALQDESVSAAGVHEISVVDVTAAKHFDPGGA
jgi:hypothetical protein